MAVNRHRSRGLTLLELMLALGLSVVLLFSIGMALRLYWKSFDVKRTNVEQAHLARAILDRMKRDIQSAVQFTPMDLSGLEAMTSTANIASALGSMTGGGGGGSPGAGAGSPSGAGSGGTAGGSPTTQQPMGQSGQGGGSTPMGGGATSGASTKGGSSTTPTSGGSTTNSASGAPAAESGESAAVESTEGTPPAVVGLYGSEYELQFDISRLPRIDEYAGGSPTSMVQIPSDIKTVTYYVRSESAAGGGPAMGGAAPAGSMEPSTTGQGRGLVRMEMDRAVSAFDESSGTSSIGKENARLLAEEVTSITFRYWNGTEWATDWNSDDSGGLPLAIEIVMTMADPNAVLPASSQASSFGAPAAETSTDTSYRIVVNLPTASLPPPAEEPAEGDAAAEGSESTAVSGNSASGSPASGAASGNGGATGGASGGQTGAKK